MIHPGTRFLRIGRASDVFPVAVPHVIARKSRVPVPPPQHVPSSVARKLGAKKNRKKATGRGESRAMDVDQETRDIWDLVSPFHISDGSANDFTYFNFINLV